MGKRSKVKVALNHNGIGAMLRSPGMARMVRASGDRIAQRAGKGAKADTFIAPGSRKPGGPRVISGVKFPPNVRAKDAQERALAARGAGRV